MNNLFQQFKTQSAKQWGKKIKADLKGKDYDSLIGNDGISPFYHADIVSQNQPLTKENS